MREHNKRVRFVEECNESLNSLNFAEVHQDLELRRTRLLQTIQSMSVVRDSPLFFKKIYQKFKKEFDNFEMLLDQSIFQQDNTGTPLF